MLTQTFDPAFRWGYYPREKLRERTLPRAVPSQQGNRLPALESQIGYLYDRPGSAPIPFRNAAQNEGRLAGRKLLDARLKKRRITRH
ncbi:hypothetical protein [Rathayibacter iranicus]|uniref:Uncharacterized protein n=1 Tax=Rathayibacter iranicus NCPPB 2253 = VKM Ac-1602 TaxID=1328868 RepID=A0ABX5LBI0_9MICO|nr:hypothetical protein [Rathayibacter iranicus]PWJ60958.1 hypothetical protein B0H03_12213 [Rathayibacter iranicus NCPPB 2253 = VKM Ac-1602]